jgi:hypothetical protein
LKHSAGGGDRVALKHTFNAEQIAWWRAGSALNTLNVQF